MNVFEVGYYDYDGIFCTTWAEDNACYGSTGEPCYYVARVVTTSADGEGLCEN